MLPELTVRCPECFSFMNVKLQENGKESGLCNHCHSLIVVQRTDEKKIIKITKKKKSK